MNNTTVHKPPLIPLKYDLKADLDYFISNQDELVKLYNGKVLVIVNKHVEGAYNTVLDAYVTGKERFGSGGFSIRKCTPGPKAYTMTIRNLDLSNAR
jgi:hypothetical protein